MTTKERSDLRREWNKGVMNAAIAVVITIVLQSAALLWWGGAMSARMDNVEQRAQQIDGRVRHLELTAK